MKPSTRRDVLKQAALVGAATLGAAAAQAGQDKPQQARPRVNTEEPVPGKATADDHGPREMFAVVDRNGKLQRGMHVAVVRHIDVGFYEVEFRREIRRGVYLATIGGHANEGLPPTGYVSVQGRSTNPRAVLVSTCNTLGENVNMGFHLLVVCPDGYA
jgi:hypothetical protein